MRFLVQGPRHRTGHRSRARAPAGSPLTPPGAKKPSVRDGSEPPAGRRRGSGEDATGSDPAGVRASPRRTARAVPTARGARGRPPPSARSSGVSPHPPTPRRHRTPDPTAPGPRRTRWSVPVPSRDRARLAGRSTAGAAGDILSRPAREAPRTHRSARATPDGSPAPHRPRTIRAAAPANRTVPSTRPGARWSGPRRAIGPNVPVTVPLSTPHPRLVFS